MREGAASFGAGRSDLKLEVLSGAAAAEQRAAILEHLRAFNQSRTGPAGWEPLCVGVFGEDTALEGGLYGTTLYDWLVIELLFVPERHRGSGLGSRLVAEAEEQARARGCVGAWVDTFSFQARGFYEKLGYCLVGAIPDHPIGGERYFLSKRWMDAANR